MYNLDCNMPRNIITFSKLYSYNCVVDGSYSKITCGSDPLYIHALEQLQL